MQSTSINRLGLKMDPFRVQATWKLAHTGAWQALCDHGSIARSPAARQGRVARWPVLLSKKGPTNILIYCNFWNLIGSSLGFVTCQKEKRWNLRWWHWREMDRRTSCMPRLEELAEYLTNLSANPRTKRANHQSASPRKCQSNTHQKVQC